VRLFVFVILTKRAARAAGRISDSFAPAKPVPVLEIAQRSFSSDAVTPATAILFGCSNRKGCSISKPVPAVLAPRCPRSFLPLALLALSG